MAVKRSTMKGDGDTEIVGPDDPRYQRMVENMNKAAVEEVARKLVADTPNEINWSDLCLDLDECGAVDPAGQVLDLMNRLQAEGHADLAFEIGRTCGAAAAVLNEEGHRLIRALEPFLRPLIHELIDEYLGEDEDSEEDDGD